jgi:hypothetical protein
VRKKIKQRVKSHINDRKVLKLAIAFIKLARSGVYIVDYINAT